MRKYPEPGSFVRVKETGQVFRVKAAWKPSRAIMWDNNTIYYLSGLEPAPVDAFLYWQTSERLAYDHLPHGNYAIVAAIKNPGQYTGWTLFDKNGSALAIVNGFTWGAYNPKGFEE